MDCFRQLRERNGLTPSEAAELLGVSEKTVRRIETGKSIPKKAYTEVLELRLQQLCASSDEKHRFTFIDLFAGIGGMRIGFEAVGGKCIFTSEWDRFARTTYRARFPADHEINGDIRLVTAAQIPDHDVLLAGFPCQPFSIAGVSKKKSLGRHHGFMDQAQGTLFFEVLRILKEKKPTAFLLENVKNLRSHDKGRTIKVIEGALEDLGYSITSRVIDAKGYVPQHRERVFIAGFKKDTGFDLKKLEFKDPSKGPRLESILHSPEEEAEEPYTLPVDVPRNAKSFVAPTYTLSNKLWEYLKDYAEKHREKGNGFGFGLNQASDTSRTLSARYYKDGSEILIDQGDRNPRRLTPRECARLMGFDPNRETRMRIPVSDTQAYKQFGNAVVPQVVEEIARYMLPHILRIKDPGELFRHTEIESEEGLERAVG